MPVSELSRSDGDLVLIFLSGNGVLFSQPTDDGWYRATTQNFNLTQEGFSGTAPAYRPDEAAFPMACLEQWQWCNGENPDACGPLGGLIDALIGAAPVFNLTAEDLEPTRPVASGSTESRLIWAGLISVSFPSILSTILGSLELKSLASQTQFYGGVQRPIREEQWKYDVTHWWNILNAQLQASYVETALGPSPALMPYVFPPLSDEEKQLCASQVRIFPIFELSFL
jgi:hypothetical protein